MRLIYLSLLFLIFFSLVQCDKTSPEEVKNPTQKNVSDSLKKVEESSRFCAFGFSKKIF